jgi:LCP family protein required for cell wall assembly
MAVIRMSLDTAQFQGKREEKKQPQVTQRVPPIRQVPFQPSRGSIPISRRPVKNTKKSPLLSLILVLVVVGLIYALLNKAVSFFSGGTVSNVQSLIPVAAPKLQKDSNGKTNVLLVGIDTRETGQLELNTDTIILASYDDVTHRLAMVSFPRDLSVVYPTSGNVGRINGVYAASESKKKGTGLAAIQGVVEEISGQKIQYAGMVDLKGFIDAINVLGGIDIYLDYDLSGLYPINNSYEKVSFKKGWNHLDGVMALKYARIRKSVTPKSEEGDFARGKRQQKVIQSVLDKVAKTETLLDAKKLYELFSIMKKNVKSTPVTLEDVQAGVTLLKEKGKPATYSYVMDFYAGGSLGKLIDVINYNPYLIGPVAGQGKWDAIKLFIADYIKEPTLPAMDKKVLVYDGSNGDFTAKYNALVKKYYYVNFVKGGVYLVPNTSVVYSVGGKNYEYASKALAAELGIEVKEVPTDLPVNIEKNIAIMIVL